MLNAFTSGKRRSIGEVLKGRRPEGRTRVTALARPDGTWAESPEEAADLATAHWQEVFSAKEFDLQSYETLFRQYSRRFPEAFPDLRQDWSLDWSHLRWTIDHPKLGSAPGPDGIPFYAYAYV